MKITPRASNHIEIELDDGTRLDLNDGTREGRGACGLFIRDLNARGIAVKQDPLTDTIEIQRREGPVLGRDLTFGEETRHRIYPQNTKKKVE